MKLQGKLRIGIIHTGDGDFITLGIEDTDSHVHFLEVHVSPEDAFNFYNNRHVNCEIQLRGMDLLGKVREHRDVILDWPEDSRGDSNAMLAELCEKWIGENPGWAITDQKYNWHYNKNKKYHTHAVRFVNKAAK